MLRCELGLRCQDWPAAALEEATEDEAARVAEAARSSESARAAEAARMAEADLEVQGDDDDEHGEDDVDEANGDEAEDEASRGDLALCRGAEPKAGRASTVPTTCSDSYGPLRLVQRRERWQRPRK